MTTKDAYKYSQFKKWIEENVLGIVFTPDADAFVKIKAMQMLGPDWSIEIANDGRDIRVQPPIKRIHISFELDLNGSVCSLCGTPGEFDPACDDCCLAASRGDL